MMRTYTEDMHCFSCVSSPQEPTTNDGLGRRCQVQSLSRYTAAALATAKGYLPVQAGIDLGNLYWDPINGIFSAL